MHALSTVEKDYMVLQVQVQVQICSQGMQAQSFLVFDADLFFFFAEHSNISLNSGTLIAHVQKFIMMSKLCHVLSGDLSRAYQLISAYSPEQTVLNIKGSK